MKVFAWLWVAFIICITLALVYIPLFAICINIVMFVLLDAAFLTPHDGGRIFLGLAFWFALIVSTSKLSEDALEEI